ncbi:unnamed protein product, partial [Brugia timori]|uniref:RRM domain-containing protein n=1 Tax=Brugia timori TaxID=42155 RepID=A0A0R3Q601_9BILA
VRKFDGGEENVTYDNIFNATHAANTSVYVGGISPITTGKLSITGYLAMCYRLFRLSFMRHIVWCNNVEKSVISYKNLLCDLWINADEELMQSFSAIATVIEVRLFKQQGYAFVRYLNKDAAARAIMSMNGKVINGQKIRCSWSRTTMDNINISNQVAGSMNLLTNNIIGFSPLINPVSWSQNQCLPQFCGHPLFFSQYSHKW